MTDKEKIKELIEIIEKLGVTPRDPYDSDYACELCEYDKDYKENDWCPGVREDYCFKLSKDFKKKYLG